MKLCMLLMVSLQVNCLRSVLLSHIRRVQSNKCSTPVDTLSCGFKMAEVDDCFLDAIYTARHCTHSINAVFTVNLGWLFAREFAPSPVYSIFLSFLVKGHQLGLQHLPMLRPCLIGPTALFP